MICQGQSMTPCASRWSVLNMQVKWFSFKTTIMLTKVALMVVPCKIQGLHMPSLLPPAARTSTYSQDNGLLSPVSVH